MNNDERAKQIAETMSTAQDRQKLAQAMVQPLRRRMFAPSLGHRLFSSVWIGVLPLKDKRPWPIQSVDTRQRS